MHENLPSEHGHATALALFREWIAVMGRADNAIARGEYDSLETILDEGDKLETQIFAIPASGPIGLALKGYLLVRANRRRDMFYTDPAASLGEITPNNGYEPDGTLRSSLCDLKNYAADLVRFLPELAPLAAGVVKAPPVAPTIEAEQAEIRRRAEALAAEYGGPLPNGDPGLIEAERRVQQIGGHRDALYRKFRITPQVEEEILQPTIIRTETTLRQFIKESATPGLDGLMVKRRLHSNPDYEARAIGPARCTPDPDPG
jgi:hypothetical protein